MSEDQNNKARDRQSIPNQNPMRFFENKPQMTFEPETPEIQERLDAEEKANFLLNEAGRLDEHAIPEPARSNTLSAMESRYRQWRNEQTQLIAALPDPEMQYRDSQTVIRLGAIAGALLQDVDQLFANARADMKQQRTSFMKRWQDRKRANDIERD